MSNSGITTFGSTATGASRVLPAIFMFVLSVSFGAGQVRAQCGSLGAPSTTWQNGGNSFWGLDGNWTSGTPTASKNACILNGLSTVTLNTTGNAKGLQLATGNSLNINAGESLSLVSGLSLNDGEIGISGTLNSYGTFDNANQLSLNVGGVLNNFGTLNNAPGASIGTFVGSPGLITNYGVLVSASNVFVDTVDNFGTYINNGEILTNLDVSNASGASLISYGRIVAGNTLTNKGTVLNYGDVVVNGSLINNIGGIFINNGTIIKQPLGDVENSGKFVNNSEIFLNIDSGLSNLAGGFFSNAGTIIGESAGVGNSGRFNNSGTILLAAGFDPAGFDNAGVFNNNGMISVSGGGFESNNAEIFNSGTLNNSGTINIAGPGPGSNPNPLNFFSNSGTLRNSGALNIDGIPMINSGTFKNSGAVTISSLSLFTTSTDYKQTAGSTLVDGTLTATSGAIVDIKGGTLSGTGTINGDVLMKGIMSPGSDGVPGALTIIGNYEQGGAGVFDELISGGNSNGVLDVTGVLALDPGSLLGITLQGGFNPLGDSFTILNYGSLVGEFSNGSQFFADGFEWTLSYGSNDAVLKAVSAPEPGTMSLIGIGFLAILGFAAKRRAAL